MVKVISTFGATYDGGILRVLRDGLPHLNATSGLHLAFGDIYEREDIKSTFRAAGVSITQVGVECPPYTSVRDGIARQIDRVRAVPRHCLIAYRLRRAAKQVDVIYVHTYKELVLAASLMLPPRCAARIVWHCHGLDDVPPLTARFANLCTRIIAISGTVADRLREIGVPGDRIITILNAVDLDGIAATAGAPLLAPLPARRGTMTVVLLPTASIRANKGIHLLLEAARNVPDLEVWVTGAPEAGPYSDRLIELSKSMELAGRVHFLGFRPDIYSVMRAADIICVPSVYREGFGLVAAEGMAMGKPVVVSDRGALPEVVRDGTNGVVVNLGTPHDLRAALQKLVLDPRYAYGLGVRAAEDANERFSYHRWAGAVAQVLSGACRNSPT